VLSRWNVGLGDWFTGVIENTAESFIEGVERKGRNIARVGDAIFGCEEYENKSVSNRLAGASGLHSKTSNDEKSEEIYLEAKTIISKAKSKMYRVKVQLNKQLSEANEIVENNYNLKMDTVRLIDNDLKPIRSNFNKMIVHFESIATPKVSNDSTGEKGSAMVGSVSGIVTISDYYKVNKANKYLDDAKEYAILVDIKVNEIKVESTKIKKIKLLVKDEYTFLSSILNNLKLVHPDLIKVLSKKHHTKDEAKKALFLGHSLDTLISLLDRDIVSGKNTASQSYIKNVEELKEIYINLQRGF